MTVEAALVIIDAALKPEKLNNLQELIFRQSWDGKSYQEIAATSGYNPEYIKDVGYKLWQLISKALGEKITKANCRSIIRGKAQQTIALPLNTSIVHGGNAMIMLSLQETPDNVYR